MNPLEKQTNTVFGIEYLCSKSALCNLLDFLSTSKQEMEIYLSECNFIGYIGKALMFSWRWTGRERDSGRKMDHT